MNGAGSFFAVFFMFFLSVLTEFQTPMAILTLLMVMMVFPQLRCISGGQFDPAQQTGSQHPPAVPQGKRRVCTDQRKIPRAENRIVPGISIVDLPERAVDDRQIELNAELFIEGIPRERLENQAVEELALRIGDVCAIATERPIAGKLLGNTDKPSGGMRVRVSGKRGKRAEVTCSGAGCGQEKEQEKTLHGNRSGTRAGGSRGRKLEAENRDPPGGPMDQEGLEPDLGGRISGT